MNAKNRASLAFWLIGILAVLSIPTVLSGGLYVGKHEGDMLHLLEIVFRFAEGQRPHIDFMTPIGLFAYAPISWLVAAGQSIGMAIIWGQILFAVALLPAVWWVGVSRFSMLNAWFFGLVIITLCVALVHGTVESTVSISMHYNRMAWAVAFVATAIGVVPARRTVPVVDGIILGLLMVVLAMIKTTYFVAFAPAIIVGLLSNNGARTLGIAAITGVVATLGLVVVLGLDFFLGYLGDLLTVMGSEGRSAPGEPLAAVVASPAYLPASVTLLAGIILLRQGKRDTAGMTLLLLAPAFWYVSYQNFGNDPQWLMLLAVLLFAWRPEHGVTNGNGWDMRQAVTFVGIAALALSLPSLVNLAYSPYRHMQRDVANFEPILPAMADHHDLQLFGIRAHRTDKRTLFTTDELAAYEDGAKREDPPEWQGETFEYCTIELGLVAWYEAMSKSLAEGGFADGQSSIFTTDLFSPFWLYGDFVPAPQAAPWYYGGLDGLAASDYILVPFCPVGPPLRSLIIREMNEAGVDAREVQRTDLYVLYEKL
ncbi:hypothetical protein [Algirhabdus cladophorae]|uniref:hypothetical protein n=1 Tax=Algirhabdus cladophorae TaxID=3377108 RepID=UPI003B849A59